MASYVGIASSALMQLGKPAITAMDEDSDGARLANRLYADTRDAVLRAHPWNFALTRKALAQNQAAPLFGWTYSYALPTDPYCLRVLTMEETDMKFKVEGRNLLTDESPAQILYIARIADSEQFDTLFVDAYTYRLAAQMAYTLTGSSAKSEFMWKLYEARLREARTIDGMEGTPAEIEANILLEARHGAADDWRGTGFAV